MWNAFWMTRYETTKVAQFRIRAHDQGLRYNKTSNKNVHLLLQHCFKSSQPRCALTTHESNCLATNQVVAGCGKKERRELLFFLQQNLYMLRVLLAQQFCFSAWRRDSPVILSNPKSVFTQLATTWFGLNVFSNTRNVAFELILQQCRTTSCTVWLPILP